MDGWQRPTLDLRVPKHDSARVLDSFFYTRTFQTFLPLSLFPSSSSPLSSSSLSLLRHLRSSSPKPSSLVSLGFSYNCCNSSSTCFTHSLSHCLFFFFFYLSSPQFGPYATHLSDDAKLPSLTSRISTHFQVTTKVASSWVQKSQYEVVRPCIYGGGPRRSRSSHSNPHGPRAAEQEVVYADRDGLWQW